jgi:hypothetical protein
MKHLTGDPGNWVINNVLYGSHASTRIRIRDHMLGQPKAFKKPAKQKHLFIKIEAESSYRKRKLTVL